MPEKEVLVAFGSNEGDSREIFRKCLEQLQSSVSVVEASKPVQTAPIGGSEKQEPYLNAVIRIKTSLGVEDLHAVLIRVEEELGRVRRERWGVRKIDLDLLLYEQDVVGSDSLVVPHPRMSFRRFVLEPAVEIAPNWIHPVSNLSLSSLLDVLNKRDNLLVIALSEPFDNLGTLVTNWIEENSEWDLTWASDRETFENVSAKAKLVVLLESESQNEFTQIVRSHRGPLLNLKSDVPESEKIAEILAAVEATKPL